MVYRAAVFVFVVMLLILPVDLNATPGFDIVIRQTDVGSAPGDNVIREMNYPPGTICEAVLVYATVGRVPSQVEQFAVFLNNTPDPLPRSQRSPRTPFFRNTEVQFGTAQPGRNRLTVAALDASGDIIHSRTTSFICVQIVVETLECDFDHNITLRYRVDTASPVNLQTVETRINANRLRNARRLNRPVFTDTILTNAGGWGEKRVDIKAFSDADDNRLNVPVYCPRGPVAVLDEAATALNTPVTLDPVANDLAFDGGSLILAALGPGTRSGGGLSYDYASGQVTYTPPPGFVGVDEFNYGIRGTLGGEQLGGIVRVTVQGPPPVTPPPVITEPPPTLEPTPAPPVRPTVACPAGMVQVAALGETVLRDGSAIDMAFDLPPDTAPGVLVIVNMVGHPELGCPASGDPLCEQVQDNEAFDVFLNGDVLGSIGDPGGHGWWRHELAAAPGAGAHTIRFTHIGADPNGSPGSTTVEAAYCAPPPPGDA